MDTKPVVQVGNDKIYPLVFTPETLQLFWEKARQFPTIYGHEVKTYDGFIDMFFTREGLTIQANGLFWVLNDFTGVFYLTEMRIENEELVDANAHYTFFDKRHRGRVPLVKEMLQYWFKKYGFQRLSAHIPNYTTPQARHFAQECGMAFEGKRRKATFYKGDWFDVSLFGILKSEVLNGSSN